ncbi:MAG: DTW domain-containing protein [Deltaproteobacteria bacterium]|nr:DTW domain-containing protein [Deltaproteobacteria bacterium]
MVLKDAIGAPIGSCSTCERPLAICVCDRTPALKPRRRLLILQHPQERDVLLGTARLLAQSIEGATLAVGLSWRSLAHALGETDADPGRWAVLFPDRDDNPANARTTAGVSIIDKNGNHLATKRIQGLVALDGSWSQAKTLWWRNPWLLRLPRVSVTPSEPSLYGRLRVEPRRELVSTLEAVAATLTACGEDPEIELALKRVLRTMLQRARDVGIGPQRRPRRRPPRSH